MPRDLTTQGTSCSQLGRGAKAGGWARARRLGIYAAMDDSPVVQVVQRTQQRHNNLRREVSKKPRYHSARHVPQAILQYYKVIQHNLRRLHIRSGLHVATRL